MVSEPQLGWGDVRKLESPGAQSVYLAACFLRMSGAPKDPKYMRV